MNFLKQSRRKNIDRSFLLTWSNHVAYICSELFSHETKYAENEKSREEAWATIDKAYNHGIP